MSWSWTVLGFVLILAELILPGAIVVFLGLAALIVSTSLYLGLISGWISALTLWFISSLVLIIALRHLLQKFIQGDVEKQNTDEDLDAFGALAIVTEKIDPEQDGRIDFRGTSWKAKCFEGPFLPGMKVKIISREDITWIVEASEFNDES